MRASTVIFGTCIIGLLLTIVGCAPVNIISTEVDPGVESMGYQTYNFADLKIKAEHPEEVTKTKFNMLKDAVANELEAVGLSKADDPDLWVNIGVVVKTEVQTRETDIRDAPMYMGTRSYHWESQEIPVGTYQEGTVTIDLVDAKEDKMVGQAVASSVIVKKDEKMKKRIDQAMAKVFDELWEEIK